LRARLWLSDVLHKIDEPYLSSLIHDHEAGKLDRICSDKAARSIQSGLATRVNDWSDEETDNPLCADDRNFYKVEKWTKDGTKIDCLLYAGKQSRQSAGRFCEGDKAPAADQADDPAANAGTG
jgi:hypothetical protein